MNYYKKSMILQIILLFIFLGLQIKFPDIALLILVIYICIVMSILYDVQKRSKQ